MKVNSMEIQRKFFILTMGIEAETHPYKNGYVKVYAKTDIQAREIFNKKYPAKEGAFLRFSFSYTWEDFQKTGMFEREAICHEEIE